MRKTSSWVPVLAAATGAILVTSGAAGSALAAAHPASGHGGRLITRTAQQTVTNYSLSGNETSVSCLSASRCVTVGSQGSHGVVVTLTNGQQSHAAVLRRSSVIDSVSCRKSGCWAIGHPSHGTGAYMVKISSAGRAVAERIVKLPAGTRLGPISCASPTSCEIAGADNRIKPTAIAIGTWNGKKLQLHLVKVKNKGSKRLSMTAISCLHSDCEAVGADAIGPGFGDYLGLILTTAGGKPARLNANSGYPDLDGVSCISAKTCYAVGNGGEVVTVTRGVATHGQGSGVHLTAIECVGSACEVAGWVPLPQYSSQDGWVQILSGGKLGASIDDSFTPGFTGIAARGGSSHFIAIGTGGTAEAGSDVAVG